MEEPIELVTEYQRKLNKNSSAISREHLKVLGIKKQTDISSYFAILDADIKFSRPIWWWVIDIFTVEEDFENIDTAEFAKDFVENDIESRIKIKTYKNGAYKFPQLEVMSDYSFRLLFKKYENFIKEFKTKNERN